MLNQLFKDIDELINHVPSSIPAAPISEVLGVEDSKTSQGIFEAVKFNSSGLRQYKIDEATRSLIIDKIAYKIPNYFNLPNFIAGDIKTLDYVFYYFGFNYEDFEKD